MNDGITPTPFGVADTSNETNSHTFSKNIEDKDLYKTAVDTRNLEINLFWQRSNYFLVLNSVLALGFFNSKNNDLVLSVGLAIFGMIASFLWFRVTLGSKYWQARWEQRLSLIEKSISPGVDLFSASPATVQSDVENAFKWRDSTSNEDSKKNSFKKTIETKITQNHKNHSVSFNMTLLSMLFIFGWFFLATFALIKLIIF